MKVIAAGTAALQSGCIWAIYLRTGRGNKFYPAAIRDESSFSSLTQGEEAQQRVGEIRAGTGEFTLYSPSGIPSYKVGTPPESFAQDSFARR